MKISTRSESAKTAIAILLPAILLCLPLPARADHCHSEPAAEPAEPAAATETANLGSISVPDVELVDQDGNRVHFYSDLVKDRMVAMNFIFTTCTTICPPMGANFAKLQKLLGEDAGTAAGSVELISVSVDPVVDTPQRLKIWGDKFGRGSGGGAPRWTLLTGSKTQVDRLLKSLQVFTADKDDHSPIVLLGNAASNRWTRTYGLTAPAQLVEMVAALGSGEQLASATATQEGR